MRTVLRFVAVAPALALFSACSRESAPAPAIATPAPLRELLRDARALAVRGDGIWPGFSAAPFDVLLVEDEGETLFCRAAPVDGFIDRGRDPVTGCNMQTRERIFDPQILASFPAFGETETIVIGAPEAAGLDPARWALTVLHEHFHQYQATMPGHQERIGALDLAGGDETGMWMLNYPFPYDSPETADAFASFADALLAAVEAIGKAGEEGARADYLEARRALRETVSESDWRYFEFQLWKEGVARWTEIALGEASGEPRFEAAASGARARVREELLAARSEGLSVLRRTAFYSVGAAESLLLDAQGRAWRERYLAGPLALGPLLE